MNVTFIQSLQSPQSRVSDLKLHTLVVFSTHLVTSELHFQSSLSS